MKTQVFLVDYENVQPDVLPALALVNVKALDFVGPPRGIFPLLFQRRGVLSVKGQKLRYGLDGENHS